MNDYLKDLEENTAIHHRDKVIIKMWCDKAIKDIKDKKNKEFLDLINNFNFGYDYNRDCMIKERLIKIIKEKNHD
jgi:hypothetical protein